MTTGLEKYISGVISFEETLGHETLEGKKFVDCLNDKGIVVGVKADEGLKSLSEGSKEQTTLGLETLPDRLAKYKSQGAQFAKWRSVFLIGDNTPSKELIQKNCADLAYFASACQNIEIVPMIEPEVLIEGDHAIKRCHDVSIDVLSETFKKMRESGIDISQVVLKMGMITSGNKAQPVSAEEVAKNTLSVLSTLPKELPMIAFLSGGQAESVANDNLSAICNSARAKSVPFHITYSFGRSLQKNALKIWSGIPENTLEAQKALLVSASQASAAVNNKLTL